MIVVCDINEIWRRKPFVALAEQTDVLGVAPMDWLVGRGHRHLVSEGRLEIFPVRLPPSWASRTALLGQRMLWRKIQTKCKSLGAEIDGLVVTSPHYLPLLNIVPADLKTIYYASDDYFSYDRWESAASKEKLVVQRVDHAFFISDALKERALEAYGVDEGKLSVSMNATEPRFFPHDDTMYPVNPPSGELKRPIAGVVGGIGDRLDLELLRRCAELDELGTLLLVGPLPEDPSPEMSALLSRPKCVAVGAQPHDEIHRWFQCLDVGLIPYNKTELNRFCSPMRLFDHLASGSPIIATDSCDQVKTFPERVAVCSTSDSFMRSLRTCLSESRPTSRINGIAWNDRAGEMLKVMGGQGVA